MTTQTDARREPEDLENAKKGSRHEGERVGADRSETAGGAQPETRGGGESAPEGFEESSSADWGE